MKHNSKYRHVKTDYAKFSKMQCLNRIKSLEQYVKWLEERLQKVEKIREFFHGGPR